MEILIVLLLIGFLTRGEPKKKFPGDKEFHKPDNYEDVLMG